MVIGSGVRKIVVEDATCNGPLSALDLSSFPNVEEFVVGYRCFMLTKMVRIVELRRLKRIFIGAKSFSTRDDSDSSCQTLIVRDCPLLKEVIISTRCFVYARTCILKNLPSLEVLDIGDMETRFSSMNFLYSPIALQGWVGEGVLWVDLPKLKRVRIGRESFHDCNYAYFESACAGVV